jgi:hypothetical protein
MAHVADQPSDKPPLSPDIWKIGDTFYAQVSHPASDGPVTVILHGVRSYDQASQAASFLNANPGESDVRSNLVC